MRIIPIILMVVVCAGCAVSGQPDRQGNPVGSDRESHLSAPQKETIQKLVEGSDVVVLGNVTGIYDGTARDGGMSYDVRIEAVLYGKDVPKDALRFRSAGWIGFAQYKEEERVLLFLKRWRAELIQVHPVCYLIKQPERPGVFLSPVQESLDFIKGELRKK